MMWGMHMGYGPWTIFFTALLWIGLLALGVWLLARLFPGAGGKGRAGSSGGSDHPAPAGDTALEVLRRRYARGELTKEEYETIRHDLTS
jgi:putative membrane protein